MGLVKDKNLSVLLEKINPTAEPTAMQHLPKMD
jgi:hypothetical protein